MKSAFLLLFLATTAAAQPFVSEPVAIAESTRPTMQTRLFSAMSIARDGAGFVAAWSGGTAIYAARLTSSLQPIAPIREIRPYLGDAYEANYPDIAPLDGGGYAVVWLERQRLSAPIAATAVLARFSAAFEPSRPSIVNPLLDTGVARIAGGDANSVSVLVQGNLFTVDPYGGTTLKPINGWQLDDAVTRGGPIGVVGSEYRAAGRICPGFGGCITWNESWSLKVQIETIAYAQGFSAEFGEPSIGAGDGTYLVAWQPNVNRGSGSIVAARVRRERVLDSFDTPRTLGGGALPHTHPSIAWDGERFLIAWQTTHGDISGAAMTPDGAVQSFTLVATPAEERNPIVVGVGPGRFALAYEIIVDDQHRQLMARTVDFKASVRRRAAR